MSLKMEELVVERCDLIKKQQAMITAAGDEKRSLNDTETPKYESMDARINEIEDLITKQKALDSRAKMEVLTDEKIKTMPTPEGDVAKHDMDEFRSWCVTGKNPQYESRALQSDIDTAGGFLRPPVAFVEEIIGNLNNQNPIRGAARVIGPLSSLGGAKSLGVATRTGRANGFAWGTELAAPNFDSTLAYGARELIPKDWNTALKVSFKLLAAIPGKAESEVSSELNHDLMTGQGSAFNTGTGAGQALGLYVASADGISTSRDVTGTSTTLPTYKGLIAIKYKVRAEYWNDCSWHFHQDLGSLIRQLQDGAGTFIFAPQSGQYEVDTILGRPVLLDSNAPNTYTASQYYCIFGAFRHYWIVDDSVMTMQRLNELYAATGQVGFIVRGATDGAPMLEEAFARGKLAAA
jgi:HK97 family phage major capsid protein